MTEADKEMESERYFIYLMSNPRRDVKEYLMPLLGYFHFHVLGYEYLKFKKSVYNDHKQTTTTSKTLCGAVLCLRTRTAKRQSRSGAPPWLS
jgi:hypothetical protein